MTIEIKVKNTSTQDSSHNILLQCVDTAGNILFSINLDKGEEYSTFLYGGVTLVATEANKYGG